MSQVFQVADEILVRQARARTFSTENTKWTGFMIVYSENKNTDYTKENTKYGKQNTKYSISIKEDAKKYAKNWYNLQYVN